MSSEGHPPYVPLSTNLVLKYKRSILYLPMDFGELTIDGLVDTGALTSAIPESDLRKIKLLTTQSFIKKGPPPNFQIMVANGQLETPKATEELRFDVGDIVFHEIFLLMDSLTEPIIGLMLLLRNHTVLDMRRGKLIFPNFSMQLWTVDHKHSNVMELILIHKISQYRLTIRWQFKPTLKFILNTTWLKYNRVTYSTKKAVWHFAQG